MTSPSQDVQTGNVKDVSSWKRRNLSSTATDGCNSERVHGQTFVPLYVPQEKEQSVDSNGEIVLLTDYKLSAPTGSSK